MMNADDANYNDGEDDDVLKVTEGYMVFWW